MTTLKRFDILEEVMIGEMFDPLGDMDLLYYASDVMDKLGCDKDDEMELAI